MSNLTRCEKLRCERCMKEYLVDVATMDAAFAETRAKGHSLMRDTEGGYLLMEPIDAENVRITPLETNDETQALALAEEAMRIHNKH
jgi:hypothetical protein